MQSHRNLAAKAGEAAGGRRWRVVAGGGKEGSTRVDAAEQGKVVGENGDKKIKFTSVTEE